MSMPALLSTPLAARVQTLPPVTAPIAAGHASAAVLIEADKALDAGKTHYTDRLGILPLRQKISALLAAGNLSVVPDAITITCGTIESRFVALKQLVPAGGSVATTDAHTALLAGALTLLGLTLAAEDDAVNLRYVQGAAELKIALFQTADWIMYHFQAGDTVELPSEHAARVVIIGEYEQLAGWRVGYMAGSSAVNKLRAYKQSMTICAPSVSQWAALGADA